MIDLQSFCANPQLEMRLWMQAPFRTGKWVYATNGHYCVRVPATTEPEATGIPKNTAALFDKAFADTAAEFHLLPSFPQAPTCEACGGSGINPTPDPSDEDDECWECIGRGFRKWMRTQVGDAEFELGYLNKMQTLPHARIATHGHKEPMAILFDGGHALLMPMTKG